MKTRKSVFDDGFQAYLTEGAVLVGNCGIPMLMDLKNTQIPRDIVPFSKLNTNRDKRKYIHFYLHDKEFSTVLTATTRYLDRLKLYDGVITPDCTMLIGQSSCLQQANTYMNRAVGFFLQKNGIPVIPNIRWSDETSFEYCFLGVPKGSIVSVSTHGCLKSSEQKRMFKTGMTAMLEEIEPQAVLVHGYMPDSVFGGFNDIVPLYRYASEFERTHIKEGA